MTLYIVLMFDVLSLLINIVLLLTVLPKICSERNPDVFGMVTEIEAEVQCHRFLGQISGSLIP